MVDAWLDDLTGWMYYTGRGIPKNLVFSYMWFSICKENDVDEAKNILKMLAGKMSPSQIAEAKKLASEWKPGPRS